MHHYVCLAFTLDECKITVINERDEELICTLAKVRAHPFGEHHRLGALCQFIKPYYMKHTRVMIAIPHQKTMTQHFMLDAALSDHDVLHFLYARSASAFGYSREELCIDYEKIASDNDTKQTIKTVATYKTIVDGLLGAFCAKKITIHVIDIDSFALERYQHHQHTIAIINSTPCDENTFRQFGVCFGLSLWNRT